MFIKKEKKYMTIPYNASASSIIDYLCLKDNFDKKKNPDFESYTEDYYIWSDEVVRY